MVLGAAIEVISGQPYEEYITKNILKPLGMSRTGFIYSPEMAAHEAIGSLPVVHFFTPILPVFLDTRKLIRERQGKMFWFNRVYIDPTPSSGLIGTAPDVGRLMMAYLNKGTLDGVSILKPQTISMMTDTKPQNGLGLSWQVRQNGADFYLEHQGGGPGFATIMRLYPDKNLGVAILANGTDLDYSGCADLLAKIDWK